MGKVTKAASSTKTSTCHGRNRRRTLRTAYPHSSETVFGLSEIQVSEGLMVKKYVQTIHMASAINRDMSDISRLPVRESTRDRARVTKAKLGVTWDEFVKQAIDELDPDTES